MGNQILAWVVTLISLVNPIQSIRSNTNNSLVSPIPPNIKVIGENITPQSTTQPTPEVLAATIQLPEVSASPTTTPTNTSEPTAIPTKIATPKPTKKATPSPTTILSTAVVATSSATPHKTSIPKPTPTTTIGPKLTLDQMFTKYADEYHVDKGLLQKIAKCESNFNPRSANSLYAGLFQFSASTWGTVRSRMGLDRNVDLRLDAEEAIKTAAYFISKGGQNAWPNCSK